MTTRFAYFPNKFLDENDQLHDVIWQRIDLKTRETDKSQGFTGWQEIDVPINDVGLYHVETNKKIIKCTF